MKFSGPVDPNEPDEEYLRQFNRLSRAMERVLWVMLTGFAVASMVLGVAFMFTIGGGRSHLAGRLMVAVAAVFVLGALDTQATRLANRRRPLLAPDPPWYRRIVVSSSLVVMAAAVLLFGLALFLP